MKINETIKIFCGIAIMGIMGSFFGSFLGSTKLPYEVIQYISYDRPLYNFMNGTSKTMYTRFNVEVRKYENNKIEFYEEKEFDWYIADKNFTFIKEPNKNDYLK